MVICRSLLWCSGLIFMFSLSSACASVQQLAVSPKVQLQPPIRQLFFATGAHRVRPAEQERLQQNVLWLQAHPEIALLLTGHTDERGSSLRNLELGDRRARAVMRALTQRGVGASRMIVISRGETEPFEPHHTPSAWARNRRVEIEVR